MSRKTRVLQKRFAVFCEGDTEYNYIDKMRKNQGVELVLKPINMHGGGYSNFLQKIKTESQSNYLAKFIIMDNPDFEYVACLHSPQYRGQDPHKFIESVLGAKSIAAFKGNADVYTFLNSGELSYQTMMESLRGKEKLLYNRYEIKKKNFDIMIKDTFFDVDFINKKSSNIEEFFDVIDW
ncbi:MAG TPA: hypothetical protein DDX70_03950 [Bacteroides sp.]|nr:hypothetical protein [Bacteroides sp.]